jgi:hypothetical protein
MPSKDVAAWTKRSALNQRSISAGRGDLRVPETGGVIHAGDQSQVAPRIERASTDDHFGRSPCVILPAVD